MLPLWISPFFSFFLLPHPSIYFFSFFIPKFLLSMAPIKLNQSPNSAAKSVASSTEARILVRETLRVTANLASPPLDPLLPTISPAAPHATNLGILENQFLDSTSRLICCEEIDGRRWNYVADIQPSGKSKNGSIRALCLQTPQAPIDVSICIVFLLSIKCLVVFVCDDWLRIVLKVYCAWSPYLFLWVLVGWVCLEFLSRKQEIGCCCWYFFFTF